MRTQSRLALAACLLLIVGCSRAKTTAELIADLRAPGDKERLTAARLLPRHKADAAQVVPALIEALKDAHADIRWSAAIGLGEFGDRASDAVPALQAVKRDKDARVREAAAVALSRIDPRQFPPKR